MTSIPQPIADLFDAFEKQRILDKLRDAADEIESYSVPAESPTQVAQSRLNLWLALIDRLDRALDPTFDPATPPPMMPELPPGVSLPQGVDPLEIGDPNERRAYMDAIARNQLDREKFTFQRKLRAVDGEMTERFQQFVDRSFEMPKEAPSVAKAIQAQISSTERQHRLMLALSHK